MNIPTPSKLRATPKIRCLTDLNPGQLFPILRWLRGYTGANFGGDLFAGIITAILLVPQGIAFALLAWMPPIAGLYASILPPAIYALLGTSRTLSVDRCRSLRSWSRAASAAPW
ncbi:MAG: SulP family inorganic anion transporter [Methylococcales bacterium]